MSVVSFALAVIFIIKIESCFRIIQKQRRWICCQAALGINLLNAIYADSSPSQFLAKSFVYLFFNNLNEEKLLQTFFVTTP